MQSKKAKKVIAAILIFAMVVTSAQILPNSSMSTSHVRAAAVDVPEDRIYITSTEYQLVPGATEIVLTTNNAEGTDQRIGFLMEVDADAVKSGTIKPVATYKDYQYDVFGMQTVTDQAKAYEKAHEGSGEKVFAGINADFYNLNTGEVNGAFVMGGTIYKKVNSPYFAVLKDGTAVIRSASETDLSDVQEAVAGNMQILTNGEVTVEEGDYQTLCYSRTGIGVTAEGNIITYVTHGISRPTSCGETYVDIAKILQAQGCVNAVMLDGGGSSTYASKREGTEELVVVNNPSDGTPRTVANALCFVSTLVSDGEFDHASITPNNEYYTPSKLFNATEVAFEAIGIDASGATCELPTEELTWSLAEDSKEMGSIDGTTGVFTAKTGALGTVNIELHYKNEVVGNTSIQLVEPDELYFASSGMSLDFSESSDLGLMVKGEGVDLNIKDGDFDWKVKSTVDGIADNLVGAVENNVFIAGSKQEQALEGAVSVSYKKADGTKLSASISVEIGKMPIVKLDFEDITSNVRGKDVVGSWDWGAYASNFTDATEDQVYKFQNYDTLYYLQSTTYSSDSQWINEVYTTEQPWVESEDGTITVEYEGETYTATKEVTYGEHGQKWVSFTTSDGAGYYWRVFLDGDSWNGNFNAGSGSASAMLGADGYYIYAWHNKANLTTLAKGKMQGDGSQIVDESEGEVRFGNNSLKLTYDFTNFNPVGSSKNTSIYYRAAQPIVADGSPTGYGMWVYAPEGMGNYWLWATVSYWNGTKWVDHSVHFRPSGAEKTCQYTGINWTGWNYVEADLSPLYDAGAVVDAEHPIQVRSGAGAIQITYIPGGSSDGEGHSIVMGSNTAGYFYVDNIRWVYGTNIDDMDNPQIISAKANVTDLSTTEVTTLDTNDIAFAVDFTDPQGENYSGIDESATQLYLDGTPLASTAYTATADKAQTVEMQLANGEHTLKVSLCDNFGNRTEQTYYFVISNPDSTIPEVSIERNEKAELGGDYTIAIKADNLRNISSISTSITYSDVDVLETVKKTLGTGFYDDYGNELTPGADGLYYDANGNVVAEPMRPGAGTYSISSAVQELGENLTGTIRNRLASATTRVFEATATINETVSDDTTLLTFTLPVPSTLTETATVPYSVTVTYTTVDGGSYTVTSGNIDSEIYAYYTITPRVQVAGAENGVLNIATADGSAVEVDNVKVYSDTEEVTGTFAGNEFTTDYFVGKDAGTTLDKVYIVDGVNKHYSYRTTVNVSAVAEAKDSAHYDLTLNATTGDSATTENIVWLANTSAEGNAIVKYMTKAAYEASTATEVDEIFANAMTAEGTAKLTRFGADNVAVYINNVKLSGLSAGTTYVYRAGDGTSWSEVAEFSTMNDDGSTKFMVIADTQLLGDSSSESDQRAISFINNIAEATAGVDFGLQTGDYVDGGINYGMWDQILGVWEDAFVGTDFVHVMGNHENYGTEGSKISSAIFGLDSSEKDYYSVEYGEVYIAVINQTADLTEAAAWLVEDAANTDCTWKVLTCHQPIYYTNPNGSNDGHHNVLKVACDAAGIDFTFSGHDHSYVRTEQMKAGTPVDYETDSETNAYVDENGVPVETQGEGTVYYICGDLGEKSRGSEYAIVNNPDFHFAKASQDYDALYLTVDATSEKMTVNTWNMKEDGSKALLDTYTMYTGEGVCSITGEHELPQDEVTYNPETGKLICDRCEVEVEAGTYTGYVVDKDGTDEYGDSQYYFLAGNLKTGFFPIGDKIWYANEAGLIDHATENKDTNTCTENGNQTAYSPRYEQNYTGGKVPFTGHAYVAQEDGNLVCSTCDHTAIDIADWTFSLSYTSTNYTGYAKYPAVIIQNPETGETLEYATDGMGRLTDYTRVWSNNKNVGTATVVVEANSEGDYTNSKGAVTLSLKINPPLPKNVQIYNVEDTSATLSWSAAKQADGYRVYQWKNERWSLIGKTTETTYQIDGLNCGTEYQFAVRSYTEIDGITYTSIGYTDAVSATTTAGVDISDWSVKLAWTKTTYNGNNKRPTPTVKNADGETMVRGTDYTVEYVDNQNAGTATVIITGTGQYCGTKTTSFYIAQQEISGVTVAAENAVFTGGKTDTTVTVTDKNGKVMTKDVDFKAEFTENTGVGIATVKVTGIGNYTGTVTATYTITEKDISGLTATVKNEDLVYTGTEVKPVVEVEGLEENKDFTVSYADNVNVGTAKVILTGIGNYTGSLETTFGIEARDMEGAIVTDRSTYTYTGQPVEVDVEVQNDLGVLLVEGEDYEITEYKNNVNTGFATVVIQGMGNYTGAVEHEYEIQSAPAETLRVEVSKTEYTYSGAYRKPAVTVYNSNNEQLTVDVDYTFEYKNNKNAGTATVEVTGIGNYAGVVIGQFTIKPVDVTTGTMSLEYETVKFTGGYKYPDVVVKTKNGTRLAENKNYSVTYVNNKNAGTAEVIVEGIGNYTGTKTLTFEITPADITKCNMSLNAGSFAYTGSEVCPTVKVKTAKGTTLKNGVNYTVEYVNNVEKGTAEVMVNGTGNYAGSKTLTFVIEGKIDLSGYAAKLNFTIANYSGTAKRPGVTVTDTDGNKLVKNEDYTVNYLNNVEIGTATVIIEGIGEYQGEITKTFKIRPQKPTGLAVVSTTSSTIKVNFDRDPLADKYYIYVNGKYIGCAKTVNYYTIKNLSSGTSYDITTKAVKVIDGTNYYSQASNKITVSTK